MRIGTLVALIGATLLCSRAGAQTAQCSSFFVDGQAPAAAVSNPTFCHSFYAVGYSTTLHDPLWSAEHLTRDMAIGGDNIKRKGKRFGKQTGLSAQEQGSHDDYDKPKLYDRGHMTPANDAKDYPDQADTFVITNVVPQTKRLNEGLWKYLEESVHQMAEDQGELYIVTGPVFGPTPPMLGQRIAIPLSTFKAVYVPATGEAAAYIATNENKTLCTIISVSQLAAMLGFDPFPSLAPAQKAPVSALALPHGVEKDKHGKPRLVPLPDCHPSSG
jgi:endonuclease G